MRERTGRVRKMSASNHTQVELAIQHEFFLPKCVLVHSIWSPRLTKLARSNGKWHSVFRFDLVVVRYRLQSHAEMKAPLACSLKLTLHVRKQSVRAFLIGMKARNCCICAWLANYTGTSSTTMMATTFSFHLADGVAFPSHLRKHFSINNRIYSIT